MFENVLFVDGYSLSTIELKATMISRLIYLMVIIDSQKWKPSDVWHLVNVDFAIKQCFMCRLCCKIAECWWQCALL